MNYISTAADKVPSTTSWPITSTCCADKCRQRRFCTWVYTPDQGAGMLDELRQIEDVDVTCGSDRLSDGWSTLLIHTQDDQRMWQDATNSGASLRHICYPLLQLCMGKPSPSRRQKYGPSTFCNHQPRAPLRGPGKAGENNVPDHGQACDPDQMRRKNASSTYGARQYRTDGRHKQHHCGAPGKNSWCTRKRPG